MFFFAVCMLPACSSSESLGAGVMFHMESIAHLFVDLASLYIDCLLLPIFCDPVDSFCERV